MAIVHFLPISMLAPWATQTKPRLAPPASDLEAVLPDVCCQRGMSINAGAPKWMVWNGKSDIEMDDFGGNPISGNPI